MTKDLTPGEELKTIYQQYSEFPLWIYSLSKAPYLHVALMFLKTHMMHLWHSHDDKLFIAFKLKPHRVCCYGIYIKETIVKEHK